MSAALLSGIAVGIAGLVAAAVFGLGGTDVSRHIAFGFFPTMLLILAHSMMMFYLIGKGKAVKDAMSENGVAGDYYNRIAAARKPVFSVGSVAMVARQQPRERLQRHDVVRDELPPKGRLPNSAKF